jgi:Immunity protein 35
MITKSEAFELVSERLRQMGAPDNPFAVVEKSTIERPFGWVFFYNSQKYIETGVFRYRLAGNGPIIVNKNTQEIELCGANKPVQELIDDYERRLAAKVG